MREHDRAADSDAKFVAGEGRNSPLVEIAFVIEEISGVERGVADEFEGAAVDLVGAGFRDDVGEAGRAMADLRGHHAAAGLHFLNGIDVEVRECRAAEFGIGGVRAVHCENRGNATLAVDCELLREICGAVGIGHGSGGEEQQFAEVALVERQARDFLTGEMLATAALRGAAALCCGQDANDLILRPKAQARCVEGLR